MALAGRSLKLSRDLDLARSIDPGAFDRTQRCETDDDNPPKKRSLSMCDYSLKGWWLRAGRDRHTCLRGP
jgi:hypothetical protein